MLYLAPWVPGPRGYGFSPGGREIGRAFSAIDLRTPDGLGVGDGFCLLWSPGPEINGRGITLLAAGPEDPMLPKVATRLGNALDVTWAKSGRAGNFVGDLLVNDRSRWAIARGNRHGLIKVVTGGAEWYREQTAGRGEVALDPMDDFNRTNETPLAGDWTTPTGGDAANMNLVTNAAQPPTNDDECCAYWNLVQFDPDHWSQCVVLTLGTSGTSGPGPAVRMATTGLTGYFVGCNNQDRLSIYRYVGDSASWAEITAGGTVNEDDTVRLEANGDNLRALVNGGEELATTDTNNQTEDRIGIQAYVNPATLGRLDNWQGANIAGTIRRSHHRLRQHLRAR